MLVIPLVLVPLVLIPLVVHRSGWGVGGDGGDRSHLKKNDIKKEYCLLSLLSFQLLAQAHVVSLLITKQRHT